MSRRLKLYLCGCSIAACALWFSTLLEAPVRSALRGYDNTFNYVWLRSAMVDGDWDFANDIAACNTLVPEQRASALALPRTATGRLPNKYGVGWALVSLPFYVVADVAVGLVRSAGWTTWTRDGFNPAYQISLQLGHLLLAVGSLWLAVQTVRRWLDATLEHAAGGVLLVWAASPLFYYQTVNLSMSHGVGFFAMAVFAYGLTRVETADGGAKLGEWALAGAGWGLAIVTRFQLVVFGVVVAAALFCRLLKRRVAWTAVGAFALGALPFLLLQLAAWRSVYGEWLVFGYGAEGEAFHWGTPEFARSLFSARHGLFYWHPFLLIAFAGMLRWAARDRNLNVAWAGAVVVSAYVSAAWWCWWFASAFGNRSYDAALLPLMAGAAWWLSRGGERWATAIWTCGVAAGIWNVYLAILFRAGAIPRNLPVTWSEMLRAAERLPDALRF